jgi:hypothetical protein
VFGIGDHDGLSRAVAQLDRECGIKFREIPDPSSVHTLFSEMSTQGSLTHEARVALLYRLVAMSFLLACKLMRDRGEDTPPDKLLWLTTLLDRSVQWSERASDHITFEGLTSQLNMNIERLLSSFRVFRGSGAV